LLSTIALILALRNWPNGERRYFDNPNLRRVRQAVKLFCRARIEKGQIETRPF
jgi:hypothetical protein